MSPRTTAAALAALLVFGCRDRDELGSTKVHIEAKHVEQLCRGTIAHAESELAHVEAELEIGPTSEPIEIVIATPEQLAEHCDEDETACVEQPPRRVFISAAAFDDAFFRELVRGRLAQLSAGSTKPIFFEGLAMALTRPMCRPLPNWEPPSSGALLSRTLGTSFAPEHLYVAGTLLRWMLDTYGPAVVLDFMDSVARDASANEVRLAYLERFGSSIDAELYNHWPPFGVPIAPERAGCIGEEPPRDPSTRRIRLTADFDCDSPRVHNDFQDPSRVFVEWILEIDERTVGRYEIVDELPEGVTLTVEHCGCEYATWTEWPSGHQTVISGPIDPDMGAVLLPGTYRLRAYAPIGTKLDHELLTPCDYEAQNCPEGQQCTRSRTCENEVPNPGQAGDACSPSIADAETPLACEVGLTCLGPAGEPGVCMAHCGDAVMDASCPDATVCSTDLHLCAPPCDPLTQDCAVGESCWPDFTTGEGACVPSKDLGPLETCSTLDLACGPGLSCEEHPSVPGCTGTDPDAWIDFTGCCTPICDPSAADPGCPPELPVCKADGGDVLGTCQP